MYRAFLVLVVLMGLVGCRTVGPGADREPMSMAVRILEEDWATVPQPTTQSYVGPILPPWTNIAIRKVTVGWDAPTQNVNGTPLFDLAGYRVYNGLTSGFYTAVSPLVPAVTNRPTATNNVGGQYTLNFTNEMVRFMAVTALDTSGNESDFSEELMWTNRIPGTVLRFGVEATEDLSQPWTELGFFRLNIAEEP